MKDMPFSCTSEHTVLMVVLTGHTWLFTTAEKTLGRRGAFRRPPLMILRVQNKSEGLVSLSLNTPTKRHP